MVPYCALDYISDEQHLHVFSFNRVYFHGSLIVNTVRSIDCLCSVYWSSHYLMCKSETILTKFTKLDSVLSDRRK